MNKKLIAPIAVISMFAITCTAVFASNKGIANSKLTVAASRSPVTFTKTTITNSVEEDFYEDEDDLMAEYRYNLGSDRYINYDVFGKGTDHQTNNFGGDYFYQGTSPIDSDCYIQFVFEVLGLTQLELYYTVVDNGDLLPIYTLKSDFTGGASEEIDEEYIYSEDGHLVLHHLDEFYEIVSEISLKFSYFESLSVTSIVFTYDCGTDRA